MDVRVGLSGKLSAEELMLSNCSVWGDSWEFLGLQGDQNQSTLKEISPEYSLEGLMLKVKLQYFGHLMRRGKFEGKSRSGAAEDELVRWYHWLHGHKLSKLQEIMKDSGAWHVIVPRVTKSLMWLSNWTTSIITYNQMSALMSLVPYNVPFPYLCFPFYKSNWIIHFL